MSEAVSSIRRLLSPAGFVGYEDHHGGNFEHTSIEPGPPEVEGRINIASMPRTAHTPEMSATHAFFRSNLALGCDRETISLGNSEVIQFSRNTYQECTGISLDTRSAFFKLTGIEKSSSSLMAALAIIEIFHSPHKRKGAGCSADVSEFDPLNLMNWDPNKYFSSKDEIFTFAHLDDERTRFVLLQYAPRALLMGVWFKNLTSVSISHLPTICELHKIQSQYLGGGALSDNSAYAYNNLLKSMGLHLPEVSSSRFSYNFEILDISYEAPLYWLAISDYLERYYPEILGVTLANCKFAIPKIVIGAIKNLRSSGGSVGYVRKILSSYDSCLCSAVKATKLYLDCISDLDDVQLKANIVDRIHMAYSIATNNHIDWEKSILGELNGVRFSSDYKMLNLLKAKAPFARGYHNKKLFHGKTVDESLENDPVEFLIALANSKLIKRGESSQSRLLMNLIGFRGPMFRVFSRAEIKVISDWIESLPVDRSYSPNRELKKKHNFDEKLRYFGNPSIDKLDLDIVHACALDDLNIRQLFYCLINKERYPEIRKVAKRFVFDWLDHCAVGLYSEDRCIPFETYSKDQLWNWFRNYALGEANSYTYEDPERTARDSVVHDSVQLCPMVLIDGGWLQSWCDPSISNTNIACKLFVILSDEIGNGDPNLNHPNVYRELMNDMGVEIPLVASNEFAETRIFENNSFKVPVFWMSLSMFPKTFLPEMLGLNLAMELSGVGNAYRRASDTLKHYGYSTLFVDLHNTIDNASTGHSAMAVEAIVEYMEQLESYSDHDLNQSWKRIWTGYRSLVPPNCGVLEAIRISMRRVTEKAVSFISPRSAKGREIRRCIY